MNTALQFDPYHVWLGIPAAEQPPTLYRLLGVQAFESDPAVIESAADRQMAHVRTYQSGQHSAESQRLLNELSAARVCLLTPARKVAYDASLQVTSQPEVSAEPAAEDWAGIGMAVITRPAAASKRRQSSLLRPATVVSGGVAGAIVVLGIWAAMGSRPEPVQHPAVVSSPVEAKKTAPPKSAPKVEAKLASKTPVTTAAAVKDEAKRVYLDDLQEVAVRVNGRLGKRGFRNNSEALKLPDLDGLKAAPHGLFTHPFDRERAGVTYHLGGSYSRFSASAAIAKTTTEPAGRTPLTFAVLGDGKTLWQSRPLLTNGDWERCDVQVTGVQQLTLQVSCPGDSWMAWAAWYNPMLIANE